LTEPAARVAVCWEYPLEAALIASAALEAAPIALATPEAASIASAGRPAARSSGYRVEGALAGRTSASRTD